MKTLLLSLFVAFAFSLSGQGNWPAWDIPIPKDSSIIKGWANSATVHRGYINIADPSLGQSMVGSASAALGAAEKNGVLSLGDSGYVDLSFDGLLFDGPGIDLAVYENAYDSYFLELAFLEVSSDGIHFFRFPAQSLTDTSQQVNSFDSLNASLIHNLAGKYSSGKGVGFDLNQLSGQVGLDIQNISTVRVVDVVGSMNPQYASRDARGNKVNDPFPTPFPSGGFDLDAVAAVHLRPTGTSEFKKRVDLNLYPNPSDGWVSVPQELLNTRFELWSSQGKRIYSARAVQERLQFPSMESGLYFIRFYSGEKIHQAKIILR